MPHIHTAPGQHDITVSAWILRIVDGEPKALVHMHRKMDKLMQVGGHVEIDETPWQALAHEIREESGYELNDLKILQPYKDIPVFPDAIVHPVPTTSNTHEIAPGHYHSDYGYTFIADNVPSHPPAEDESNDLRWFSLDELKAGVNEGIVFEDIADIYGFVIKTYLPLCDQLDAQQFSLKKP